MPSLTKIFNPLRQAAAAFFKHDLALKRQPEGLQIVLEARPPEPRRKGKASRAEVAVGKDKQELAVVLEQLGALLAEYPESRGTLKHLVFVESALSKKGLRVLHKLPLDVLQRALEQLEGLVTNWSPVGLANLRSKMAVAVLDREHANPEAEADAYRTAAVAESEPLPSPEEHPAMVPEGDTVSDDAALAAAYAALGNAAPVGEVEFQGELGSRSAKALAAPAPRASESAGEIKLRELQA